MLNEKASKREIILNGIVVGELEVTGDHESHAAEVIDFLKQKGLYKKTDPIKAMFQQALSFATTASYLYRTDLQRSPRNRYSIAPFVVNSAFSIELYLKTLARIHQATMKGHDLLVLFDSLPTEAHQNIDFVLPNCRRELGFTDTADLRTCMSELANAFIEWRYLYEKGRAKMIYIDRMIFVMKVLDEACRSTPQIGS